MHHKIKCAFCALDKKIYKQMSINDFKEQATSLFKLLMKLDPTTIRDDYLKISKLDHKIIKSFYNEYNMKNVVDYSSFIYIIKQQAVNFNMIPTAAAEVICKKLGKVNG